MAEAKVVSSTLVQAPPNPDTINTKIQLTCSDYKLIRIDYIQKGLLFSKSKSPSSPDLIRRLKTSLSQTLHFYYPLAGRFSAAHHPDNTVSHFIHCNNAGVLFVRAAAPTTSVADILDPIYVPPVVHSFFTLTKTKNYDGVSNPLIGIQITELSDGIFIGFSMNHSVGDGTTFWNFVNSWSDLSRGLTQISKPPVFDNWFRNYTTKLPVSIFNTSDYFSPPPLKERIFYFSKAKIAELKAKANKEAGVENGVVSSFQSLLAHLWRAVIRNREIDHEKGTKLLMQIGLRQRMKPEIPDGYFGNAIQGVAHELKARQVLDLGLGGLALQLNKLISSCTQEKILKDIDSWSKDPKIRLLSEYTEDVLLISSSPRVNVYENDFGWGKPIAVRSGPGSKFGGKITVYPGTEQGSIDAELCFSPKVLESIGNDMEFMDAVTV